MTIIPMDVSPIDMLNCAADQARAQNDQALWEQAFTPNELAALEHDWDCSARQDQLPPDISIAADTNAAWTIWLLLGGRGAGKTRAGAEWIRRRAANGAGRIALIAPNFADAREVMIEGESGLANIGYPAERPRYESSRRRLLWPSGAVGYVFSAEDPDGLRGPQFDCAWADEFCAWTYPEETLSNLRFGLRLGERPQMVMTTTPKPIAALRGLLKEKSVAVSHARTEQNQAHLSPAFMRAILQTYGDTRLGRQELGGEVLDETLGALWSRNLIEGCRERSPLQFEKIIVAVDPPVTGGARADSCGIVIAGRVGEGQDACAYVLEDATVQGLSPEGWARKVLQKWQQWDADYILAEVNQGGEMINSVFKAIGSNAPLRTVYASKGKTARAEPVAALYEQGRVFHAGSFTQLEDEMCLMKNGRIGGKSPDRADALVWAITDLMLKHRTDPRIRAL